MISIVVGVNLVPTIITSINTASTQAAAVSGFSGLSGLMQVLAYVCRKSEPLQRNLYRIMSQIRGKLNTEVHANLELSWKKFHKCVETRWFIPRTGNGIVLPSRKSRSEDIAVILLGAVAWIGGQG